MEAAVFVLKKKIGWIYSLKHDFTEQMLCVRAHTHTLSLSLSHSVFSYRWFVFIGSNEEQFAIMETMFIDFFIAS